MNIRIPYSRTKRYLRGNDWIICALDQLTRKLTGTGNLSQVVLHLAGEIPEHDLRARLEEFVPLFPALGGRPARDWINLAPYWRMCPKGKSGSDAIQTPIDHEDPGPVENPMAQLERAVNASFRDKCRHLAFHLVPGPGNTSYLGMTFDHRLLDARGAEMFLQLIERRHDIPVEHLDILHTAPTEPAHLDEWISKFRAGKQVNRAMLALARLDLASLPIPRRPGPLPYRFRIERFNEKESSRILETAHRKAGYLMVMPHLLAATIRALHPIFRKRGISGEDYVAVVTLDTRKPSTIDDKLFFNHVSFFFFRIGAHELLDHESVIESLKAQMYSQVRTRQPQHFEEASMLMRILPLRAVGILLRHSLRSMMGSFGFSHIGQTAYTSKTFMDLEVLNLFHMPRVATPPGIGVFFNQFRTRLNMTLAYLEGVLEEAHAMGVVVGLRDSLTGECDQVAHRDDSM